jgi:hypothetical protein
MLATTEETLDHLEGMPIVASEPKQLEQERLNSLLHECRDLAERLQKRVSNLSSRIGNL